MKILIVEDNILLSKDIKKYLEENGFIVELAATLNTAIEKVNVYQYELAIIDLGLPDGNGLELINLIKKNNLDIGILIVTAKNSVDDKVTGLKLGADDYLTKPFHMAELNARVFSILRRGRFQGNNELNFNEIRVNLISSETTVDDTLLQLTKKEFDLLVYFMYNSNKMLTKENIVEHLWGDYIDQSDSFDFIYNHIKNLRKKIEKAGGKNYIHSMYGMGYKFFEKINE